MSSKKIFFKDIIYSFEYYIHLFVLSKLTFSNYIFLTRVEITAHLKTLFIILSNFYYIFAFMHRHYIHYYIFNVIISFSIIYYKGNQLFNVNKNYFYFYKLNIYLIFRFHFLSTISIKKNPIFYLEHLSKMVWWRESKYSLIFSI